MPYAATMGKPPFRSIDDLTPSSATKPLVPAPNHSDLVAEMQAFLRPAEEDIAAGRLTDHADFMRTMRERYRA